MSAFQKELNMDLNLKETVQIDYTSQRKEWIEDPEINKYIYFQETQAKHKDTNALTDFHRYYEVYDRDKLIGDIKIFYETETDILQKRGQLLMIIGERNNGIGTTALKMLLEKIKDSYNSVYCQILRSNIASLKILKNNGFQVEGIEGEELTLSKYLN
jgi:RimJ/RimL family protein N-acetyltransferase